MKTFVISAIMLILICCSMSADDQIKSPTHHDQISPEMIIMNVEIVNILPIGWGVHYVCNIQKLKGEVALNKDSTFVFSIAVRDDKFKPVLGKAELTFAKTLRVSKESYIPGGTTGMMDDNRTIWELVDYRPARVPSDRFTVHAYIHSALPISWGTKYTCNVIDFQDGATPALDSTFVFFTTEIDVDFPLIDIGEAMITFDQLKQPIGDSSIPANNSENLFLKESRMADKNNVVWTISDFEQF